MLGTAAVIVLSLLPRYSAQVTSTDAKCLSGYTWMFSSINQSPCDVAAELAAVCVGGVFELEPLDSGYVYLGPSTANANTCRCSSVYYSLLSACAYCQGRNYLGWTGYSTNCSTVYVTVYDEEIPVGVKVPAYAYQNVVIGDTFNVTLAQATTGPESSRPASAGTATKSASSTTGLPNGNSSNSNSGSKANIGAIVGGVVGGVVGLGLIGALIAFFVIRSKPKAKSEAYDANYQQGSNMAFTPNTTASLIPTTMSPAPSSPGKVYDPNDPTTFPATDPSSGHVSYNPYTNPADPYRQQSPFNPNLTTHHTGGSAQTYGHPQTMPFPQQYTGLTQYSGAPEL